MFVLSYDPSRPDDLSAATEFSLAADTLKLEACFATSHVSAAPAVLYKHEMGRKVFSMPLDGAEVSAAEMISFVELHNHLLVNPIDKSNFRTLGRTGKPLVLAVVDYSQDSTSELIVMLDEAASELDAHVAHSVVFGHMDGIRWKNFLRKFGASVPSILVMDLSVNGFYVVKSPQDLGAVKRVVAGALSKELEYEEVESHDLTLSQRVVKKMQRYYPWSVLVCMLPVVFAVSTFMFPHPASASKKNM